MYFTEVDVSMHSKYVAFYFCIELFSGLGFLKVFSGSFCVKYQIAIARIFLGIEILSI